MSLDTICFTNHSGRAEKCNSMEKITKDSSLPIKKKFGQHFLRKQSVADNMVQRVSLTDDSSVFEIGCGDGFLTRTILEEPLKRLWIFEIDPYWANYVKETIKDDRLKVDEQNILDLNFEIFDSHKPWVLLANLPYQITFPILHLLQRNREMLKAGVVMMQEEIAQKIIKTHGRVFITTI